MPLVYKTEYLNQLACDACPICFDTIHDPTTTDCKHTFCNTCLRAWLRDATSCPLCRYELYTNSLIEARRNAVVELQQHTRDVPRVAIRTEEYGAGDVRRRLDQVLRLLGTAAFYTVWIIDWTLPILAAISAAIVAAALLATIACFIVEALAYLDCIYQNGLR